MDKVTSASNKARPRWQFIALICVTALIAGYGAQSAIQAHKQNQRYVMIEKLRGKSDYHDRILKAYLSCVREEGEAESTCISNTILLADLNGYRNKINEVFSDAKIPSR